MEEEKVLLPHQQRVVKEQKDLELKIKSLEKWIANKDNIASLKFKDSWLLVRQFYTMKSYNSLLKKRIKRF